MNYIAFNMFNVAMTSMPTAIGIQADVIKGIVHHRRGWAVFSLLARTGKAWSVNVMVLGLWISSHLEQPDYQSLGPEADDQDYLSTRKYTWGFNYFQRIGGSANEI